MDRTHLRFFTRRSCIKMLADGGFPLGSQTVLLRGINDRPEIVKKLCQELLKVRVRPYYLHQMDVAEGLEIVRLARARYDGRVRNPFDEIERR